MIIKQKCEVKIDIDQTLPPHIQNQIVEELNKTKPCGYTKIYRAKDNTPLNNFTCPKCKQKTFRYIYAKQDKK